MPIRIVSLVISAAIAALCLTNPIAAVKSGGNHDNYLIKYSELLSDATIEFPDADTALTVRGFIDSVLLALDSAELPLAVRTRIGAMRSAGAEYLLEEMIQYPYRSLAPKLYNEFIASITPDSPITREQAAFLLNAMLLLAERDLLVTSDTVPQILSQSDYEYTISSLDSAAARRKLSAFFSLKSVFTTDSSGNRSYSSDEAAQSLINNSPLCVIFPFYS